MQEIFVNMGQMHVLKTQGVLTTVGLGSCIGVALYDPVAKVGGMAHVFLAKSRKKEEEKNLPGKYADTAIPALAEMMIKQGAERRRLEAKIAGGAHLFKNISSSTLTVGDQNIKAVIENLAAASIPIVGKEVAGHHGRKMKFYIESGEVVVTAIGKEPKVI